MPVVKSFIDDVRERALGKEVLTSLKPAQVLVKASTELARLTNETTATIERITAKFAVRPSDPQAEAGSNEKHAEALKLASASQALLVQLQRVLAMPELERNLYRAENLSTSLIDRIFLYIAAFIVLIFAGIAVLRRTGIRR